MVLHGFEACPIWKKLGSPHNCLCSRWTDHRLQHSALLQDLCRTNSNRTSLLFRKWMYGLLFFPRYHLKKLSYLGFGRVPEILKWCDFNNIGPSEAKFVREQIRLTHQTFNTFFRSYMLTRASRPLSLCFFRSCSLSHTHKQTHAHTHANSSWNMSYKFVPDMKVLKFVLDKVTSSCFDFILGTVRQNLIREDQRLRLVQNHVLIYIQYV